MLYGVAWLGQDHVLCSCALSAVGTLYNILADSDMDLHHEIALLSFPARVLCHKMILERLPCTHRVYAFFYGQCLALLILGLAVVRREVARRSFLMRVLGKSSNFGVQQECIYPENDVRT